MAVGRQAVSIVRALAGLAFFLLGYCLVAFGRPLWALLKSATPEENALQQHVTVDISNLSTAELEAVLLKRKETEQRVARERKLSFGQHANRKADSTARSHEKRWITSDIQGSKKKSRMSSAVNGRSTSARVPPASKAPFRDPFRDRGPALARAPQAGPTRKARAPEELAAALFPGREAPPVDPNAYRISREMVLRVAQHNMVMVTWANFHYLDFAVNWVYHVEKLGIGNYIVGAMDNRLLSELVLRGVNTFSMQSGLSENDFGWGSPTFHKMGREKINLIGLFTDMGVDLLLSDVDTVWLRNPVPYILQFPEADVLTSSDHLSPTVRDESLERWPNAGSAANIGIMFFRASTAGARQLAKDWSKALEKDPHYWDQNAFNDLFRRGPHTPGKSNLFRAFDGKINLGIFPVSIFASGHTFFVQRVADGLGLQPFVVHATFQFSGTPGKRHRFRENLMWLDPPEYFDRPGGFLTFDMHIPPDLLSGAKPSPSSMSPKGTVGHFRLAHHQIQQIRNAFALGLLLDRAVVIPQLWCGLDRWWAPHAGTIPGSDFRLPFPCPLDHVLDLEQMVRPVPHLGRPLEWREHSFLQNPRLPAEVNNSRVSIEICENEDASCSGGTSPAAIHSGTIRLRSGLRDKEISTALEPVKGARIVHFKDLTGNAFGGFANHVDGDKFEERTKVYTSLWCCSRAHPGHIWYDMWFDKVPHKDRHNRQWESQWMPKTGP